MDSRIVRLPRLDHAEDESQFVLVRISSVGPRPLDLHLIGTENTAVFAVSLKHNQISSLKTKNCPCNKEEWNLALSFILLGTPADAAQADAVQGVEAVAKVEKDGSSIAITVQKRIEGITQHLGTIVLPASEEAEKEVDLYEWCGLTIESKDAVKQDLEQLNTKFVEQEEHFKELNDRFEELVKAKSEHENELLEKFSLILNQKKLKIRDQQSLLDSSKVDPEKLAALDSSRKHLQYRAAGASRPKKRKAGGKSEDPDDASSDGGFEKMDVDVDQVPNDSEEDQAETPDEEETADEASDADSSSTPALSPAKPSSSTRLKAPATTTGKANEDKPPPVRDLPFAKKPAPQPVKAATSTAADEGSETESDDEL